MPGVFRLCVEYPGKKFLGSRIFCSHRKVEMLANIVIRQCKSSSPILFKLFYHAVIFFAASFELLSREPKERGFIKNLRKNPEKLKEMVPDFEALYMDIVTDDYCRRQLDKVVATLRGNAEKGICTLFHCTAGKDRTGIVSMALLKSYGISDAEIIKDYMRTNYNALWPTIKKCVGVGLMTWNWELVKTAYVSFMARRELIETSLKYYVV